MFEWKINICLVNSTVGLNCIYRGPENNSTDVFNRLFKDTTGNTFIGLGAKDGANVLVRVDQIAAMRIATFNEEESE